MVLLPKHKTSESKEQNFRTLETKFSMHGKVSLEAKFKKLASIRICHFVDNLAIYHSFLTMTFVLRGILHITTALEHLMEGSK